MADVNPLLDWVDKQHDWARDALRRHAQSAGHAITADDKAAVLARVRQAAGVPQEKPLDLSPLTADHLTFGPIENKRSLLCSLGPLENVGRLAADQQLKFALDGITLIYGDNGSGKSGYCRVTKSVCRSLSTDPLRGNVFKAGAKPPAKALIRYLPDGEVDPVEAHWTDGDTPPKEVRGISVFDSRNAHLYVGRENMIGFLPAEISLLERHAAHRSEMDATFVAEKKALEGKCKVALPVGYSGDGAVAKAIAKLVVNSAKLPTAEEIKKLAEFAPEGQAELNKLTTELAKDPAALAARADRSAAAIKGFMSTAKQIEAALSEAVADALKKKWTVTRDAEKAAALAAEAQFSNEPLEGVGKGPWGLMYAHATAYVASLGLESLPSSEGDPCALCQQPLGPEAVDRLERFRSFVAGEAAKTFAAATEAVEAAVAEIEVLEIPSQASAAQSLAEFRTIDENRKQLGVKVSSFFARSEARRAALIAAAGTGDFDSLPQFEAGIADSLAAELEVLDKESAGFKDAAQIDTQKAELVARLTELKDRQWLKNALPTVLERLNDLVSLGHAATCVELVANGQLSTQITKVRRALVTAGLGKRIADEIEILDLGHMPFEVNDRSKDGNSLFEVRVKAVAGTPKNDEILSEGEQRALALACFLAEVGADKGKHGLVFDDPVSSLDHLRIRRVAARLVAEAAKGKQVIVFTHNLLFYNEILNLAAAASPPVPTARRVISKTNADGFGLIAEEAEPWSARKVAARIDTLRAMAKALEAFNDHDTDEYRAAAKDFYTSLRETWERLVEELLLGKVVERYSAGVSTQSLRGVRVDNDDHQKVFFAMKRVSEFSGHDQAAGKQVPTPKPDEAKADLAVIDAYRQALKKRNEETDKARRKLEEPPAAKVA